MDKIKFLRKGIRHNGQYIPVWYSKGNYTAQSGLPQNTITIYAKRYDRHLPSSLMPENESDGMTDYFEKDRARIRPTHKYYKSIFKLL
jgi:hypothetical protein